MAQAAYNAAIKTPGISTVFTTAETFTNLSGVIYQITDFTKTAWDRDVTPIIYLDGVVSTPTNINYLFGKVTVSTAGTVTASGNYLPVSEKTGFNNYTISMTGEVLDKTTFDNNAGFMRRQIGLLDASLTISGFTNPWFYSFTDTGSDLTSAIAISGSPATFTITKNSSVATGEKVRIDDEIFLVTSMTTTSTAQDTVIATRGQWETTLAAHSTDTSVFEMNGSFFTRDAFLVEIAPSGSSNDVWRAWTKVESLEHSGAIADLIQNSISLQLDSSTKADTAIKNSAD